MRNLLFSGTTLLILATPPAHHGWLHHIVGWMEFIRGEGYWGWVLFCALYALCCLLFMPGSLLAIAAGAVFGFWIGLLLVLIGNGAGSVLSLLIARFLLHDWLEKKLNNYPRLQVIQKAVEQEDWKLVLLTRLSPVMPSSLINYSLGLTNISASRFLFATEAGAIPSIALYVYAGTLIGNLARIGPDLKQRPAFRWAMEGGGIFIAIATTLYISHLATKALREHALTK